MTSTIVRNRTSTSPKVTNPGSEFDGYYTIRMKPISCGCGFLMEFVEVDEKHIIVVWEEMDDDALLFTAAEMKQHGLDPRVVEYESSFGRCVEYYTAKEKGMIEG